MYSNLIQYDKYSPLVHYKQSQSYIASVVAVGHGITFTNVKEDIYKTITDARLIGEGYDGLDSEKMCNKKNSQFQIQKICFIYLL